MKGIPKHITAKAINEYQVSRSGKASIWGDSTGKNGNYKMADSWFDDYVMIAAFKKKYLPKKILKVLKTKPLDLLM